MNLITRFVAVSFAGAIVAWCLTGFVLYSLFAIGGYSSDALVALPSWAFPAVGACGALPALLMVIMFGHIPLPHWLRPALWAGLGCVFIVVVIFQFIAYWFGGTLPQQRAPFLHWGLVSCLLAGLAGSLVAGYVAARKPQ